MQGSRSTRELPRTHGDAPAFTSSMRAFEAEFEYLCRALRRRGISRVDAEDLVQDVLLVMWRRWDDYDRARPLRLWLTGIALRVASDHRRRKERELPFGVVNPRSEAPDAEAHVGARAALSSLSRALDRLPEEQRALVMLHEIENVPMREIAEHLALSLPATYARLYAARRALLRGMGALPEDGDVPGEGAAARYDAGDPPPGKARRARAAAIEPRT